MVQFTFPSLSDKAGCEPQKLILKQILLVFRLLFYFAMMPTHFAILKNQTVKPKYCLKNDFPHHIGFLKRRKLKRCFKKRSMKSFSDSSTGRALQKEKLDRRNVNSPGNRNSKKERTGRMQLMRSCWHKDRLPFQYAGSRSWRSLKVKTLHCAHKQPSSNVKTTLS